MQAEFEAALNKSQTIQDEASFLTSTFVNVKSPTFAMTKSGAKSASKISTVRKSGRQTTTVKKTTSAAKIKPLRF
jgi:hypothetical protein